MALIRDIKRQARQATHATFAWPVYYLRTPTATAVPAHVRIHKAWNRVGDIKGSRTYPAETENEAPKLVFQLSEIPVVQRNAIVSVSATEAYRVDHVLPADDQFQTAWAAPILAAELATLDLPVPPDGGF